MFTPPTAAAAPRIAAADGEGPLQLWERYCAYQRLPASAGEAGGALLRRVLHEGAAAAGALEQPHTRLQFEAVELEGYFRCGLGPGLGLEWGEGGVRAAMPSCGSARAFGSACGSTPLPPPPLCRPSHPRHAPAPTVHLLASFKEVVRYDLASRGLVVVTGQVQDSGEGLGEPHCHPC